MKNLIKSIEMVSEPNNHHLFIYRQNRGAEVYHVSARRLENIRELFESSPLEVDITFYPDGHECVAYRDVTRFDWYIKAQKASELP